jgi:protein-tyrosine phosphatase
MIDLHCHILPGLDDGATDLAAARRMCEMAAEDGVRVMVATPHQRHDRWYDTEAEDLPGRLAALRREVSDLVEVRLGAEIHVRPDLLGELEALPASGLRALAGSRYLLLELASAEPVGDLTLEDLVHELNLGGWHPVFAHPEFVPGLGDDPPRARRLADLGAFFQLTAASVTGVSGLRARRVANAFFDLGIAHFLASDAHGVTWRPPGLSAARRRVARRWGEDVAWRVTEGHARAVLDDVDLAEVEAVAC